MIFVDDISFSNFRTTTSILFFCAPWCMPCKNFYPTLVKLSEEFGEINFLKIDVDESPEIPQEFGVKSVPTLVFLREGEFINMLVGVHSLEKLRYAIKENFYV